MIKTYTILSCLSNKSSYDQIMRKNANNFWHFYDFTIKRYISFYLSQNQKKKTLSSENLSSSFLASLLLFNRTVFTPLSVPRFDIFR